MVVVWGGGGGERARAHAGYPAQMWTQSLWRAQHTGCSREWSSKGAARAAIHKGPGAGAKGSAAWTCPSSSAKDSKSGLPLQARLAVLHRTDTSARPLMGACSKIAPRLRQCNKYHEAAIQIARRLANTAAWQLVNAVRFCKTTCQCRLPWVV